MGWHYRCFRWTDDPRLPDRTGPHFLSAQETARWLICAGDRHGALLHRVSGVGPVKRIRRRWSSTFRTRLPDRRSKLIFQLAFIVVGIMGSRPPRKVQSRGA